MYIVQHLAGLSAVPDIAQLALVYICLFIFFFFHDKKQMEQRVHYSFLYFKYFRFLVHNISWFCEEYKFRFLLELVCQIRHSAEGLV